MGQCQEERGQGHGASAEARVVGKGQGGRACKGRVQGTMTGGKGNGKRRGKRQGGRACKDRVQGTMTGGGGNGSGQA